MIKSVPSITVRLHKVCRVMTNGDRKRLIFLSHPLTIDGFFSPADNLFQLNVFVVFSAILIGLLVKLNCFYTSIKPVRMNI